MNSEHKSTAITRHMHDAGTVAGSLRALRTLAAANKELVRASSEAEFLQAVCALLVEKGDYLMAWVGFAEYGQDKAVPPVAQYGYEEGYLASTKTTWADTEQGQGPAGSAIRTSQTQVHQNVLTNPLTAPWCNAALERGSQSSIGLPLKRGLGAFGALTIHAREPDAFGEEEVALLEEVARDVAFGIVNFRTRAERDRGAKQFREDNSIVHQTVKEPIEAVSAPLKVSDDHAYSHQKRVAALAVAVANEMGLPENEVHGINVAALVHDIGSIKVLAEILAKAGELDQSELHLVQEHAQAGRDILKDITFPWPIADIVWQHHERLDGSGYPRGLRGNDILLGARILAVADVVEAMVSPRPYRPALGIDAALAEIEKGRGTAFDAAVTDVCLTLFRQQRFEFHG